MLKKLWANLRGASEWPETQATVRLVDRYEMPAGSRFDPSTKNFAEITFVYSDSKQELQYGAITVNESSELYDAKENDTFPIRVNPQQPDQYYSQEATDPGY